MIRVHPDYKIIEQHAVDSCALR